MEQAMAAPLKTPLFDCHGALGGKLVPFAGYLLPVQYAGVIEEHMAVRERAGLFDVSHMGEVRITGPDALNCINQLFTNEFTNMTDGRVRYTLLCNEQGGVVDDLLVYRMSEDDYMLVVNAANRHKDVAFMREHMTGDVTMEDISDNMAQIALQGPLSKGILSKLTTASHIPEKYYTFIPKGIVAGVEAIISRTGYTGEQGYELYCAPKDATKLWNALLEAGREDGLIPCGLGARDTLRLEAAMPLYGHEMDETISPFETGLEFGVKMGKPSFVGKEGLIARGEPKIKRVGLKVVGRGIVREHADVYLGDARIGATTSGTHCPYLQGAYAMALVDIDCPAEGKVTVDVRGRRLDAEIIPLPFIKR